MGGGESGWAEENERKEGQEEPVTKGDRYPWRGQLAEISAPGRHGCW